MSGYDDDGDIQMPLLDELAAFLRRHPNASMADVMAEFEFSYDEAREHLVKLRQRADTWTPTQTMAIRRRLLEFLWPHPREAALDTLDRHAFQQGYEFYRAFRRLMQHREAVGEAIESLEADVDADWG